MNAMPDALYNFLFLNPLSSVNILSFLRSLVNNNSKKKKKTCRNAALVSTMAAVKKPAHARSFFLFLVPARIQQEKTPGENKKRGWEDKKGSVNGPHSQRRQPFTQKQPENNNDNNNKHKIVV
jgi:hypothetical protein